jgi:uncharacterized membrane protein
MTDDLNLNISKASSNQYKIQKTIDDLNLIDSGVIHCASKSTITIKINDSTLQFSFVNEKNSSRRIRIKNQDTKNDILALEFLNFNEPLGEGVLEPTSLFVINGEEVYFTFFIRALSDNQKEFTYSLLCKN